MGGSELNDKRDAKAKRQNGFEETNKRQRFTQSHLIPYWKTGRWLICVSLTQFFSLSRFLFHSFPFFLSFSRMKMLEMPMRMFNFHFFSHFSHSIQVGICLTRTHWPREYANTLVDSLSLTSAFPLSGWIWMWPIFHSCRNFHHLAHRDVHSNDHCQVSQVT